MSIFPHCLRSAPIFFHSPINRLAVYRVIARVGDNRARCNPT